MNYANIFQKKSTYSGSCDDFVREVVIFLLTNMLLKSNQWILQKYPNVALPYTMFKTAVSVDGAPTEHPITYGTYTEPRRKTLFAKHCNFIYDCVPGGRNRMPEDRH